MCINICLYFVDRDRDSEAEKAAEKDREERQKILDEKYSKWGRGYVLF